MIIVFIAESKAAVNGGLEHKAEIFPRTFSRLRKRALPIGVSSDICVGELPTKNSEKQVKPDFGKDVLSLIMLLKLPFPLYGGKFFPYPDNRNNLFSHK